MVVHAFNPKTRETEADRSKFEASKSKTVRVGYTKKPSQKNKRRKEKKNSRRPIKIEEKKT